VLVVADERPILLKPLSRLEPITDRPAGDEPGGVEPGPQLGAPAPARIAVRPAHVAIAILFAGALWVATTPINDLDSYWHVRIGREILQGHTFTGLGQAWLGAPRGDWRTSQWLSEVLMHLAVDHFGWIALPALRLLTACALFAVFVLTLVRRRQLIASFVVLLLLVVGLEVLFQDRPQTVSLVFLALLAAACERLWTVGRRPSLLLVAGLSLLWAQFHGLWVLGPAAFGLVAVGALLDRGRARPGQARAALLCAAASLTGMANPNGPISFLLPFTFRNSAGSRINEWASTSFTMSLTVAWGLLVCLVVWAWVHARARIPATELLWVFAWTVFGVLAVRNVGPAMLFIAPVALRALERAGEIRLGHLTRAISARESRILTGLLAATVVTTGILLTAAFRVMDPLENAPAMRIARFLDSVDRPLRIWDAYNASGVLIALGGGDRGHLKLVVDGRADLWGGPYIEKLVATQSLSGDWRQDFASFHADAMVMPPDTPLVTYLREVDHWQVAQVDGSYVLLVPPESPLLHGS
jgi:hypothetical protein